MAVNPMETRELGFECTFDIIQTERLLEWLAERYPITWKTEGYVITVVSEPEHIPTKPSGWTEEPGIAYSDSIVVKLAFEEEEQTYVRPIVPVDQLWATSEVYLAGWQAGFDCIKNTPELYTLESFPKVPQDVPAAYAGDWLSGWMDACRFEEVPDLDWKSSRPEHPGLSEAEFYTTFPKK